MCILYHIVCISISTYICISKRNPGMLDFMYMLAEFSKGFIRAETAAESRDQAIQDFAIDSDCYDCYCYYKPYYSCYHF